MCIKILSIDRSSSPCHNPSDPSSVWAYELRAVLIRRGTGAWLPQSRGPKTSRPLSTSSVAASTDASSAGRYCRRRTTEPRRCRAKVGGRWGSGPTRDRGRPVVRNFWEDGLFNLVGLIVGICARRPMRFL